MLTFLSIFNVISNDISQPWQLGFQDGASPALTGIVELHDSIFFYLVVISIGVFWLIGSIVYYYNSNKSTIIHKYLNHGTLIELIWTVTPALILIAIAFPSFRLLYILDEVTSPTITIKVTGHQWYWSYEYSDYVTESGDSVEFDSYMIPESDLELGQFRLLDVDQRVIIPVDTHIRLIVTAADVLHDYAVPSLGVKIDAVPGRLNQSSMYADRLGVFYGQCSEICGVYHGFMPTCVESVPASRYIEFLGAISFLSRPIYINKSTSLLKKVRMLILTKLINNLKLIFLFPSMPHIIRSKRAILSIIVIALAGFIVRSPRIISIIPEEYRDSILLLLYLFSFIYLIYICYLTTLKIFFIPKAFAVLKNEYDKGRISITVTFLYFFFNLILLSLLNLISFWILKSIVAYLSEGAEGALNAIVSEFGNFILNNISTVFYLNNLTAISLELKALIILYLLTSPFFITLVNFQINKDSNRTSLNLDKVLKISSSLTLIFVSYRLLTPFLGVYANVLLPSIFTTIHCQPESNVDLSKDINNASSQLTSTNNAVSGPSSQIDNIEEADWNNKTKNSISPTEINSSSLQQKLDTSNVSLPPLRDRKLSIPLLGEVTPGPRKITGFITDTVTESTLNTDSSESRTVLAAKNLDLYPKSDFTLLKKWADSSDGEREYVESSSRRFDSLFNSMMGRRSALSMAENIEIQVKNKPYHRGLYSIDNYWKAGQITYDTYLICIDNLLSAVAKIKIVPEQSKFLSKQLAEFRQIKSTGTANELNEVIKKIHNSGRFVFFNKEYSFMTIKKGILVPTNFKAQTPQELYEIIGNLPVDETVNTNTINAISIFKNSNISNEESLAKFKARVKAQFPEDYDFLGGVQDLNSKLAKSINEHIEVKNQWFKFKKRTFVMIYRLEQVDWPIAFRGSRQSVLNQIDYIHRNDLPEGHRNKPLITYSWEIMIQLKK